MRHLAKGSERSAASARERWNERVGAERVPLTPSFFPQDVSAIIYQPSPSVLSSRRTGRRPWKLQFIPREAPYIEPLMGWTGSGDTLTQVELYFPSAPAAVRYAQRNHIPFMLRDAGRSMTTAPRLVATCQLRDGNDAGVPLTLQQLPMPDIDGVENLCEQSPTAA